MSFGKKEYMYSDDLNQQYQTKYDTMLYQRSLACPRREVEFGIDTIKISSILPESSLDGIKKALNGSGMIVTGDWRTSSGLIVADGQPYRVTTLLGDTEYSHEVEKHLTFNLRKYAGDRDKAILTVRMNPNRFLNVLEEPLIGLLVNTVLPSFVDPYVSQLDFNYDLPLPFDGYRVIVDKGWGSEQTEINNYTKHIIVEKLLSKDKQRELVLYRKYEERLVPDRPDDSYISRDEAEYHTTGRDSPLEVTRIELRARGLKGVRAFFNHPESLLNGFKVRFRDRAKRAWHDYDSSLYRKKYGSELAIRIESLITKQLPKVAEKALKLPYMTAEFKQQVAV